MMQIYKSLSNSFDNFIPYLPIQENSVGDTYLELNDKEQLIKRLSFEYVGEILNKMTKHIGGEYFHTEKV